jgi:hypothetical protein
MKRRSLIDYLDSRLGKHSGNGPEYTFHCPACSARLGSDSGKKKFAVNLVKQRGQCFRCEFKFRALEQLFRYLNGGFVTPEERILLRDDPPLVVVSVRRTVQALLRGEDDARPERLRTHRLPREAKALTEVDPKKMPWKRAVGYLRRRGFDLEDARRFDLHYCATGDYSGYIIFPVVQGGETVYWTSRYCGDKNPIKSRNPPKGDDRYGREHCLLNYDAVVGAPVVALVEGPLDCVAFVDPPAIALMGRKLSAMQAALIGALAELGLEEVVIALDPGAGTDMDEIRTSLTGRVPRVTTLYFDSGDPASRRAELRSLVTGRTSEPTLGQRVRSRLVAK